MELSIIVAVGHNNKIGYEGRLPWHLRTDIRHFKDITSKHTIIAGRKTLESFQTIPLPDRTNIVITRNNNFSHPGILVAHSFEEALRLVPGTENKAYIVGGFGIYAQALAYADRMYFTEVDYNGPADTYFPKFNPHEWIVTPQTTPPQTEKDEYPFQFVIYDRKKAV